MSTEASQANGHSAETSANIPTTAETSTSKIQPNDVGWQFVPQYYNLLNKQPHRLHCFYNKQSTFIHGEEGEDSPAVHGQQEIHDRITAIGYNQCKVYIHSIDSQSSADGGIIVLVIGEMSNNESNWRKFTQTFFLAQQPNGYFVLNDIFRYLKEDTEDEDEDDLIPEPQDQVAAVEVAPAAAAPAQDEEPVEPLTPVSLPRKLAEPEPEPVSKPAHVEPEVVPEEAIVASVPDEDVAPSEAPKAVEEPVTSTDPVIEETPAPVETKPVESTTAPATNGHVEKAPSPAPVAATPAPAPAAPAKPAAPKTWASLAAAASTGAASTVKAWGSTAASTVTAAIPAAAAPKKAEPAQPAESSSQLQNRHPNYRHAMSVNDVNCFVKLPNWSADNKSVVVGETMEEGAVKQVASKFGEVVKVEIIKDKACAFVEFANVASARKAIVASLPVNQGGEGGTKAPDGGRLDFQARKEKDDRRRGPGQGQGQGQGQAQGQQGQNQQGHGQGQNQGEGRRGGGQGGRGGRGGDGFQNGDGRGNAGNNNRGGGGGGRGRGRAGAPHIGDRAPALAPVAKS